MRKQILDVLSTNSRVSTQDLAAMLGTTEEVVQSEIKAMEEEKVICGYPTLINWDQTDHEKVTALIEVKVTPQRDMGFNKVAERIYKFEEVESVINKKKITILPYSTVIVSVHNFTLKINLCHQCMHTCKVFLLVFNLTDNSLVVLLVHFNCFDHCLMVFCHKTIVNLTEQSLFLSHIVTCQEECHIFCCHSNSVLIKINNRTSKDHQEM